MQEEQNLYKLDHDKKVRLELIIARSYYEVLERPLLSTTVTERLASQNYSKL